MSGPVRLSRLFLAVFLAGFLLSLTAIDSISRARETNSEYAARREQLREKVDNPVLLFGFTGREDASPSYIFGQEENFYYLTGHNEGGAALLIIPKPPQGKSWNGPDEILFLPARDSRFEQWNGLRLGFDDAGISQTTGFATVRKFDDLPAVMKQLSEVYPTFYTLLPGRNSSGYPHEQNWVNWIYQQIPRNHLKDVRELIAEMRELKSPSEIAMIRRAVDASVEAHLAAMRMMRPGVYEYQVAARMEFVHKNAGCEREAYAPIVGSGLFSTILHYNEVDRRIAAGDIVVLDVGAECAGYAADITRTLPANGVFTPRQREIYEIVYGAQQAAIDAVKPGMTLGGRGENSLHRIALDYINAHGKDAKGQPLGKYFIHGLGHHVGLNVHDANIGSPLAPGMVVTMEPGIYIQDERLGVRIEDMVLVTETGHEVMSRKLPRSPAEIERIMADAQRQRAEAAKAGAQPGLD